MLRRTLLAMLLAASAGCATKPASAVYGSFVPQAPPSDSKYMANDVVAKLVAMYPPARTRISLRHATPDGFGASLVGALRTKGYALSEFKTGPSAGAAARPSLAAGDLALAYVVDQPRDTGLYRVTVLINGQSLSRVYLAKDGTMKSAGSWVRKE